MDKIYVTGHRNPDTDSIVSATSACSASSSARPTSTPRGLKTPARPASSPPRSMPAAWRGWCIRRSRSPARATRRIWSASTSMITLTTCERSCSRAATAATPCLTRTKRSSAHALALSPAASAAQARRTRRPQRDGAGRARARAGGNSGDHRPPPSGRHSDHAAHPRAQRARRQHDDQNSINCMIAFPAPRTGCRHRADPVLGRGDFVHAAGAFPDADLRFLVRHRGVLPDHLR